VWGALFLSASLITALPLPLAAGTISIQRGESLYHGKESLIGRIRGHDDVLPPPTVICANCHSPVNVTRALSNAAPRIDRALLLDMRQRRGGPPSRYDRQSFCKMLRTGSDPATVLIAREMPAYDISDDQCASLWRFLLTPGGADEDRRN